MKLRLPGRRDNAERTAQSQAEAEQSKPEGKGRPTPKRSEAQGRRQGPPPPPPTTRKEAYRRMRETQAANRGNRRVAAARGDDAALPARDRGPVRRLVRDVVDTRRNVGSLFLVVAAVAVIGTFFPNLAVKSYASFVLFAFFLVFIVDSVVLGRRIKSAVAERFPDATESNRTLIWYGVTRSTMIRRWRFPKPAADLGTQAK